MWAREQFSSVTIILAMACGSTSVPDSTPPPSKHRELAVCLHNVEQQGASSDGFAACVGALHIKPQCRAAWLTSGPLTLDSVAEIAGTCATEYCPGWADPKPHLCTTSASKYGDSPILLLHVAELEAVILSGDAGLRDHPGLLGRWAATLIAMVAMPVTTAGLEIQLPKASDKEMQGEPATLHVALLSSGKVEVDGKQISDDELATTFDEAVAQNKNVQVVLRADKSVPHRRVVQVLEMARSAGVTKIALGTVSQ